MRVLLTHPGLQHSHQLAWALENAGYLAAFWSGVPIVETEGRPEGLLKRNSRKFRVAPVPAVRRRHAPVFPIVQRALLSRLPQHWANDLTHRFENWYDYWVAGRIDHLKPDMVICYENAALRTFQAAKGVGAVCVLDAASVHYQFQRNQLASLGRANPVWIDHRKQKEIDLADAIITCSPLATASYQRAGISPDRLSSVPLGTDLPIGVTAKSVSHTSSLRFVFVGAIRVLKGVDLLLDIFEQFEKASVHAHLTLIGGVSDRTLATRARGLRNVTLQPFVEHPALFEEIAKHDVLVLPSRFDSFGMVVPEAMSVGVPTIVSDQVGAKCIIVDHPGAGWIVPCDVDAIRRQMLSLIADHDFVSVASVAAIHAASEYQWARYRSRIVSTLEHIYAVERLSS